MSLRQVLESRASAQLLRRTSFPPEDALQIFSSPRGGSTWLMSLLSKLPGVAGLWEPFHEAKGVVPPHWGARPHPEALHPNGQSILEGVLSGQRTNAWTCSRTSFTEARHASQLLVKYVRGNALLPFMLDTWRFTACAPFADAAPPRCGDLPGPGLWREARDLDVHRAYPGHDTLHAQWDDIRDVEDPVEGNCICGACSTPSFGKPWPRTTGSSPCTTTTSSSTRNATSKRCSNNGTGRPTPRPLLVPRRLRLWLGLEGDQRHRFQGRLPWPTSRTSSGKTSSD